MTTRRTDPAETRQLAALAARAADDKKGTDTVVLEVGEVLTVTDAFVITSAPNSRLVRTLADEVERQVKQHSGRGPLRVEGRRDLTWVLLDYGDLVVHVFSEEMRRFYDLERLYRDAPRLDWQRLAPAVGAGGENVGAAPA